MIDQKETQLIRFPELKKKLVNITRSTIDRWEKVGKFPKRINLGENSVAWYVSEIDDWILKLKDTRK